MTDMNKIIKPTEEQRIVLSDIASFLVDGHQDFRIIQGAADTGKYTILKLVLDMLNLNGHGSRMSKGNYRPVYSIN